MATVAVLTLPTLGRQPLSWDEAVSASSAQRSVGDLAGLLRHTDAPLGFYYLLLHGWTTLGQAVGISADNAWWLRLPSALAAIAAAGVLVLLAAHWFDDRVAFVAGLLFAVHPMLTYYAQDARPYTLVTLAFLISTLVLLRALERRGAWLLTGYAITVVLTLYLHLFAVFAFAGHAVLIARDPRSTRRWLVVAGACAVAVAPLVLIAHGQTAELGWIPKPTPTRVLSVLDHLAGGPPFVVVVLVIGATLLGTRRLRFTGSTSVLVVWALVPPLAIVAADFITPDLVARYAILAVPAGLTLLAVAALRAHSRVVTTLVVLAGVCALGASLVQLVQPYKYEDYRAAADTMGDLAQPGDVVVFLPISGREGFDVYAHFEPDLNNVHDAIDAAAPASTDEIGGSNRPAAQVAGRLDTARLIFVLGDPVSVAERNLRDPVSVAEEQSLAGYHVLQVRQWGDLTLTVLQRDPARTSKP